MYEYLQNFGPLDDNQSPHEIVKLLLILNTNHYDSNISKFKIDFTNFLSTTNNIFDNYIIFCTFRIKNPDILHIGSQWDRYGIPFKKIISTCGYKKKEKCFL